MKTYISLFAIISVLVASCGPKEGGDKKAQLAELKKQQSELNVKIQKLESELALENPKTSTQKAVNVQAVALESKPFVHFIEVQGRVDSDKNITVTAESAGRITKVSVNDGQSVKKGQTLAQLDNAIVRQNIQSINTSLELANNVFEKQKRLWEQKIGTELQYLQAKNNKESLENQRALLYEQLNMSIIKAPFSGVVDEVYIKEGEMLSPGVPAFRVVNPSDYKVIAEISENYITDVKAGNNVVITLPDLDKTYNAKVTNVSRVINQVNRTFSIEVKLPAQASKEVKANIIAYVDIEDYNNQNALVVPINAIQHSEEEGEYVFVAENGKAVKKVIEVGQTFKNNAEVKSGLKAGDRIITAGQQDLIDQQVIALNQ